MPAARDPAALVRELCERISEGELVAQVIADLGFHRRDLWHWTNENPELSALYARARELQAHAVAEQALQAAHGVDDYAKAVELVLDREEQTLDDMEPKEAFAHRAFVNSLRNQAVQRDKLRVDTLKWTAAKLAPKHYSERQQVDHQTPDGKPFAFTLKIDSPKDDSGS